MLVFQISNDKTVNCEKGTNLELRPDGNELLLQLAGTEIEDIQHERKLDVLKDLGIDRVSLLKLKPDHLDG